MKESLFIDNNSCSLIVSFTGVLDNTDKDIFWFKSILSNPSFDGYSKLFLKDLDNCWYLNGLKTENLKDTRSVKEFIIQNIIKYRFKNVFFLGSSMGAYGALLYSRLIFNDIDYIKGSTLAFSPQTYLKMNTTKYIKDKIDRLLSLNPNIPEKWLNLKLLYDETRINRKTVGICSCDNGYDIFHMNNLKEHIKIKTYKANGDHNITAWLKTNNMLEKTIIKWLNNELK